MMRAYMVAICGMLAACASGPVDRSRDLVVTLDNRAYERVVLYRICSSQTSRIGEAEGFSKARLRASYCSSQLRFAVRLFPSGRTYATETLYPHPGQQIDLSYYFGLLSDTYMGPAR